MPMILKVQFWIFIFQKPHKISVQVPYYTFLWLLYNSSYDDNSVKQVFGKIQKFDAKNQHPDYSWITNFFMKINYSKLNEFWFQTIFWRNDANQQLIFTKIWINSQKYQDIDFLHQNSLFSQKFVSQKYYHN